jgi:hypothetical protein
VQAGASLQFAVPKRLLTCLMLMVACGSPPSPSSGTSTTATKPTQPLPTEPDACSIERLEPEMALYCDFEAQVPTNDLPPVRWSGPAFHLLEQQLILVDAEGRVLAPGQRERVSIATWLRDPGSAEPPLVLAIADGLPASQAAELLAGLHAASRTSIEVLVRMEDPEQALPVPREPEMLAEIARRLPSDLGQRATQSALTMRQYTESCPALATSLQNLAALAPEDRCLGMAGAVARAVVDCECRQADEIMTVLYAISVGTLPPKGRVAAVQLTIDPAAAVTPASTATWGQVAGSQLIGPKPHRLWLQSP